MKRPGLRQRASRAKIARHEEANAIAIMAALAPLRKERESSVTIASVRRPGRRREVGTPPTFSTRLGRGVKRSDEPEDELPQCPGQATRWRLRRAASYRDPVSAVRKPIAIRCKTPGRSTRPVRRSQQWRPDYRLDRNACA